MIVGTGFFYGTKKKIFILPSYSPVCFSNKRSVWLTSLFLSEDFPGRLAP